MRRTDWLIAAAAIVIGAVTGQGYIWRLANHAGYFLVPVNEPALPKIDAPAKTFVIVVDGLRQDAAARMASARALQARGTCVSADVGPISISRPVYAVISTGLEQDRTGSRNNATWEPLTADSIWQRASDAGFTVCGYSELPWWQQLFPQAFARYEVDADPDALFLRPRQSPCTLTLLHPVFVDETAHDHGAASPEYEAAVARVDAQIAKLLERVDLDRDLVILTADHGHRDRGGHGGRQPELANVLTCFAGKGVAGKGVATRPTVDPFDMRTLAPTLAVLLGVPFPKTMRAGEDGLDQIFTITDAAAFPQGYLDARRRGIELFRSANQRALADLAAASWSELYAFLRHQQWARGTVVLLFALALAFRRFNREGRGLVVWLLATWAATCAGLAAVRGAFDFTAINYQAPFILLTSACAAVAAGAAISIHRRAFPKRVCKDDLGTLVITTAIACLAHIVAYGWPLGAPLPGPELLFLPFVGAIALGTYALAFVLVKR
ncbi:MAG: alkaline phosphatase family protein [Deltaproteobacteria bacterium]|nr:alkaline phosphatase family protein [Deltaproteobacteria bacterium]